MTNTASLSVKELTLIIVDWVYFNVLSYSPSFLKISDKIKLIKNYKK